MDVSSLVEQNAQSFTHMTGLQPLRDHIGQFVAQRKRRHELAHLQHASLQPEPSSSGEYPVVPGSAAGYAPSRPVRAWIPTPPGSAASGARMGGWGDGPQQSATASRQVRWEVSNRVAWPPVPSFVQPSRFGSNSPNVAAAPSEINHERRRDRPSRPAAFDAIPPLA